MSAHYAHSLAPKRALSPPPPFELSEAKKRHAAGFAAVKPEADGDGYVQLTDSAQSRAG